MTTHFVTLALDLVWSGATGAAILTLNRETPHSRVRSTMQILPPFKPPTKGRRTTEEHHVLIAGALHAWVTDLVREHNPDLIACEISDWHQPTADKRAGGRERTVQRALGRAEGVLTLTLHQLRADYPELAYWEMGAKEVKGALTKVNHAPKGDVARAIRLLYPELPFPKKGQPLDGYDAAALAHAATHAYLLKRKAQQQ